MSISTQPPRRNDNSGEEFKEESVLQVRHAFQVPMPFAAPAAPREGRTGFLRHFVRILCEAESCAVFQCRASPHASWTLILSVFCSVLARIQGGGQNNCLLIAKYQVPITSMAAGQLQNRHDSLRNCLHKPSDIHVYFCIPQF